MKFCAKYLTKLAWILVLGGLYYLGNLTYYHFTDGFTVSNITSDFAYNPQWNTRTLSPEEASNVKDILSQKFHYLGKGCQSYVFQSSDGKYVLKFFKYQRYLIKPWVEALSFIPFVAEHRQKRLQHKQNKLECFFGSWRLAFDKLEKETGLVFVHLNKTDHLHQQIVLSDKLGIEYALASDQYEFLIQKKALMLTDILEENVRHQQTFASQELLLEVLTQMLSEFQRGLADHDFALIQNTGVLNGHPLHIDVGQFIEGEELKQPDVYHQWMFNKTFKFRIWLRALDPALADFFDLQLEEIIGPKMHSMIPYFMTLDNN